MSNRERVVVYGLLSALLVVTSLLVLDRSGRPAVAGPSSSWLEDLGPAELLTLVGEDGTGSLVLRNRAGRLAWGEEIHNRAYSTAYVFTGRILSRLMRSDAFTEEREQLVQELSETEAGFRQRVDALTQQAQQLDEESDEFRAAYQQWAQVREEYGAWQQEAIRQRGKLDAEQLERAYRELVGAVEIVADRKGIDTVYRFVPTAEDFNADNPEEALLAIRLRTALHYPDELDMTDDVIEEMALEVE